MRLHLFVVLLIIGGVFGILASLMTYVITQNEYEKHFEDKNRAAMESLQSAWATFLFFAALTLVSSAILAFCLFNK
ncbi:MAG TPA: hypothetical protein VMM57_00615 [Bacteroidota bacterium]|nr:hypothetical protein [Bacteroidota bacterium]